MKANKFFEMSNVELANKLNELKADLFNLRFKLAMKQLPNPNVLIECKKDIAKVKTIIRQRELGISVEPVAVKKAKKASAKN